MLLYIKKFPWGFKNICNVTALNNPQSFFNMLSGVYRMRKTVFFLFIYKSKIGFVLSGASQPPLSRHNFFFQKNKSLFNAFIQRFKC